MSDRDLLGANLLFKGGLTKQRLITASYARSGRPERHQWS